MYLTAHRVESPSGEDGINAFHYAHGVGLEPKEPQPGELIKDGECGILIASDYSVKPGGNRIRSYVEILTLDEVPQPDVSCALITVLASMVKFPHEGRSRRCFVRVALDQATIERSTWPVEVGHLYRALLKVRLPLHEAEQLFHQYHCSGEPSRSAERS